MAAIRPRVFMSYARLDADYVHRIRAEPQGSGLDCWIGDGERGIS